MENKSKRCKELEHVDGMGSARNARERRGRKKKNNSTVASPHSTEIQEDNNNGLTNKCRYT